MRGGGSGAEDSGDEEEAYQITSTSGRGHNSSPPQHKSARRYATAGRQDRVILHVDCDEFFLQVHGLMDAHLQEIILSSPCALWQYNDVISMNAAAKALGVRKHMLPHQAEEVLKPAHGFLIHAFWRRWPGPRVNYRPYQLHSRQIFRVLEQAITRDHPGCGAPNAVVEKASTDEAYIDITCLAGGCLQKGEEVARALQQAVLAELGMRVSVGCARNRLLSKLASAASKLVKSPGEVAKRLLVIPDTAEGVDAFLGDIPASKFPGLGAKEDQLALLGATTIRDLRPFSEVHLASSLGVTPEVARRVYSGCRGQDCAPVAETVPPKSLVVTSWTTHTFLKDIAVKEHLGRGGAAVVVDGGWLFEAHEGTSKSNDTRCRWILLSMVLDLVDKLQTTWTDWALVPSKLTVGWQGCGTDPTPGPGLKYLNGETRSRTVAMPMEAREACANWQPPDRPTAQTAPPATSAGQCSSHTSHHAAPPVLMPSKDNVYITPNRTLSDEGPEQLEQEALGRCVAALVDLSAGVICGFVQEDRSNGIERQIGQLTVSVSGFQRRSGQKGIHTWLTNKRSNSTEAELSYPPLVPPSQGPSLHRTDPAVHHQPQPRAAAPVLLGEASAAGRQGPAQCSSLSRGDITSQAQTWPQAGEARGQEGAACEPLLGPPKGFDRAVWDALPPNMKEELQADPTLRQHQDMRAPRVTPAALASSPAGQQQRRPKKQRLGPHNGKGSQPITSFLTRKPAS